MLIRDSQQTCPERLLLDVTLPLRLALGQNTTGKGPTPRIYLGLLSLLGRLKGRLLFLKQELPPVMFTVLSAFAVGPPRHRRRLSPLRMRAERGEGRPR